jgi:sulfur carrier protein ThiS
MGKVWVEVLPENRKLEVEISGKMRILDLIRNLGFSIESAVVVKGNKVLTEDEFLLEDEKVTVYLASSGG